MLLPQKVHRRKYRKQGQDIPLPIHNKFKIITKVQFNHNDGEAHQTYRRRGTPNI